MILMRFVDRHWYSLDNELKAEFEILLGSSDQQLKLWLCEGREAEDEVTGIKKVWDAPLVGFFSGGEYGNALNESFDFHNETCCVVTLKEK